MRLGWRRRNCEVGKARGGGDEITTGVDDGEAEEVRTMACMVDVAQVCVEMVRQMTMGLERSLRGWWG
jgi:hypothetical protein